MQINGLWSKDEIRNIAFLKLKTILLTISRCRRKLYIKRIHIIIYLQAAKGVSWISSSENFIVDDLFRNFDKVNCNGRFIRIEPLESIIRNTLIREYFFVLDKRKENNKLTTTDISKILQYIAKTANAKDHYTSYSLRIGGINEALKASLTKTAITTIGD
ncbi:hypothetical protein ABK040_011362 [Willaertia magna]